MKHIARTDAHLAAMKKRALFAREIRTYTFDAGALLDWRTAKKLLADHGKSLRF